ncbi:hypothetical protein AB0I60_01405 [Actinosynnema sp. NPDC050436]|uniref:hypothetical protein n=1 Tax=Actinosynnema sp. NPDC050436 TaxID=3155659 RepID=UPI0033E5C844
MPSTTGRPFAAPAEAGGHQVVGFDRAPVEAEEGEVLVEVGLVLEGGEPAVADQEQGEPAPRGPVRDHHGAVGDDVRGVGAGEPAAQRPPAAADQHQQRQGHLVVAAALQAFPPALADGRPQQGGEHAPHRGVQQHDPQREEQHDQADGDVDRPVTYMR